VIEEANERGGLDNVTAILVGLIIVHVRIDYCGV